MRLVTLFLIAAFAASTVGAASVLQSSTIDADSGSIPLPYHNLKIYNSSDEGVHIWVARPAPTCTAPQKVTIGDALMKNYRAGLDMCLPGNTCISPNQISSLLLFTFVTGWSEDKGEETVGVWTGGVVKKTMTIGPWELIAFKLEVTQ